MSPVPSGAGCQQAGSTWAPDHDVEANRACREASDDGDQRVLLALMPATRVVTTSANSPAVPSAERRGEEAIGKHAQGRGARRMDEEGPQHDPGSEDAGRGRAAESEHAALDEREKGSSIAEVNQNETRYRYRTRRRRSPVSGLRSATSVHPSVRLASNGVLEDSLDPSSGSLPSTGAACCPGGAGTGKTATLSAGRVAARRRRSLRILLLTFTRRAREMINRTSSLVGERTAVGKVTGGTFHLSGTGSCAAMQRTAVGSTSASWTPETRPTC
jgi:hypothetical protein